jgi:3-carboxy-cis,cis-muconate cycloisomerase
MNRLAEALLSTPEMCAVFSTEAWLQRMLDAEAALARAEEVAGVIPAGTAGAIAAACRAEYFDAEEVAVQGAVAGTPVIALVRMLSERVTGGAADYVHFGATSQDIVDTGLMLQMRDALDLLDGQLLRLGEHCATLADRHRATPTVARTLGQHAVPMPFGLKAAQWLAAVTHHIERLRALRSTHLVAQLGGAGGTLAVLGAHGDRVTRLFAEELRLAAPDLPWHTRRDGIAEAVCALGVLAGAMAKVATDLVLLAQTEVAEVGAAAQGDKGRSSAMPHKQNPIDAALARTAANHAIGMVPVVLAAMAQEHERAAGGWQTEWNAVPATFGATAAAVGRVTDAIAALQVDTERMEAVSRLTDGRIMSEVISAALVPRLGRAAAQRAVADASRDAAETGRPFREALRDRLASLNVLSHDEIDALFAPERAAGSASLSIDRALDRFQTVQPR